MSVPSTNPGPGWYPDPSGSGWLRYFNGATWTEHVSPPASYPFYPSYAPNQRTNGFAIASLVLSIVFWGIGSILAIIFGFLALKGIKRSQGAEKGRGLAIAGISVGFGGIVLAVIAVIALVGVFDHFDREHVVAPGTTVNLANCGCGTSLSTLTVYGLSEVPTSALGPSSSGDRLWIARVDACEIDYPANYGPDGPELYDLTAVTTGGTTYSPANEVPPGDTNLFDTNLSPGQCVEGYVSFWIPPDKVAVGVEYNPDGPFSRHEWKQP